MPNNINELDEQDIGLKMVMGDRFQDETMDAPVAVEIEAPSTKTVKVKKVAQKPTNNPKEAKREPVAEPSFTQKLMTCGKKASIYALVSVLVSYWQQTGQMDSSAALPCLIVCAAMIGCTYGRVFMKELY